MNESDLNGLTNFLYPRLSRLGMTIDAKLVELDRPTIAIRVQSKADRHLVIGFHLSPYDPVQDKTFLYHMLKRIVGNMTALIHQEVYDRGMSEQERALLELRKIEQCLACEICDIGRSGPWKKFQCRTRFEQFEQPKPVDHYAMGALLPKGTLEKALLPKAALTEIIEAAQASAGPGRSSSKCSCSKEVIWAQGCQCGGE